MERVEDVLEELPAGELAALPIGANAASRDGDAAPAPAPALALEAAPAPGPDETAVLDRLDYEPASVETIARRAGLTPEQVYPILLVLEIGGSVQTDPAGRYMRVC